MKVRAKKSGYIYESVIEAGSVFVLKEKKGKKQIGEGKYEDIVLSPEDQFSKSWMEKVEDSVQADVQVERVGESEMSVVSKPKKLKRNPGSELEVL